MLQRRTPLKRTAFKRQPHQVPRKKKRRPDLPLDVRAAVRMRSSGVCECQAGGVCRFQATHMHHKWMRSQGGPDTADNLLHVCQPCHHWIHHAGTKAYEAGFLLRAGSRPSAPSP